MPLSNKERGKLHYAKKKAVMDMWRLKNAPVDEAKAGELFAEVKAYILAAGLPESDVHWFWNAMQRNEWTFAGIKIDDWRAAVDSWKLRGYFKSQRSD